MDILHVSKVVDVANKESYVTFIYYSREVRDALLQAFHNGGYSWANNTHLHDYGAFRSASMPRGLSPYQGKKLVHGEEDYFHRNEYKLYRIVL